MHRFSEPLAVARVLPAYPSLDITFWYSPSGELEVVVHELEMDDLAIEDHARETSNRELGLLFDALEYRRGDPVRIAKVHGHRIHPPTMA